ncbi:MAG: tetratricopeptide repeat protein [Pirellulaceae bacterium]
MMIKIGRRLWCLLIATSVSLFACHNGMSQEAELDELDVQEVVSLRSKSELDQDRCESSARFALGRLAFRREDFSAALGHYQRAFRYANQSSTICVEIVELAYHLGRLDQAVRYAEFLSADSKIDPDVARQVAVAAIEQGELVVAKSLLQRIVDGSSKDAQDVDPALRAGRKMVQFEIGRIEYQLGEYAAASAAFENALFGNPEGNDLSVESLFQNPEVVYATAADVFLAAGRIELAERAFAGMDQQIGNPADKAMHLARLAAARNEWTQALDQLGQYFSQVDLAGDEAIDLALDLLRRQHHELWIEKGIEFLQQQSDTERHDPSVEYRLVELYLRKDNPSAALKILEPLLEMTPTVPGVVRRCEIYFHQQRTPQLAASLCDAVELLGSIDPLLGILDRISQNREFADQLCQQLAIAAQGQNVTRDRLILLAYLRLKLKDYQLACEASNTLISLSADGYPFDWAMSWAILLAESSQYSSARNVLQRCLDENPNDALRAEIQFHIAGLQMLLNCTSEAKSAAADACRLQPDNLEYVLRQAWVFGRLGDSKQQQDTLRAGLEQSNDDFSRPEVRAIVRTIKVELASVLAQESTGQAEAIEWLEQVLDEFPDDINAMNDLGYLWADTNQHLQRALHLTQRAVHANPLNGAYRDSLGWVLFRLGMYPEAVNELQTAVEFSDSDPTIYDHLGDALLASGQPDLAVKAWESSLRKLHENANLLRAKIQSKIDVLNGK